MVSAPPPTSHVTCCDEHPRRRIAHRAVALAALLACAGGCTGTIGGATEFDAGVVPGSGEPTPGREFRCDDELSSPGPNLVRRLTSTEYIESVRALTGVDLSDVALEVLPSEPPTDGYSNHAATLVVSSEHVVAYESLAATVVSRISDPSAFVERFASCLDASCAAEFVGNFGEQAYRAPIIAAERAALMTVFTVLEAEGFVSAAMAVVEVALQSPRFVYRSEVEVGDGAVRELLPEELAARISFLVWSAPPDEALLEAARGGLEGEALRAQLDRMLDDPRAIAAVRTFADDWLRLGALPVLTRDAERFPDWDRELGADMREETLSFIAEAWLVERRPMRDVFNAQHSRVSPRLASHYGWDESGLVDLSDIPERGGLLTQGSIATQGGSDSSMVIRGRFLLDKVLCLEIESAPPGADTTPPPLEPGRSQRFYSEQRIANPSCTSCHSQMEPPAFGLERFDATGRYRLEDDHGNELSQHGEVPFQRLEPTQSYDDVAGMMDILAQSERVRDCVTLQVERFAMGREIRQSDGCSLEEMRTRFAASAGTYLDLLDAIISSRGFRTIQTEESR